MRPAGQGPLWHGGDLDEARRLFPEAPEPWIDLSTGINPIAYPVPPFEPHVFERLPPPGALADAEAAAAEGYGAKDVATVLAAPGTQILISLLPRLRPRGRVAVLGPTYAEHARAWETASHAVRQVPSLDEAGGADVIVAVNPNNPDGRLIDRDALLRRAAAMHPTGGWLVVDEAFADFDRGESLVPVHRKGLVILRSFGKTYGLAGLRLGFAIAERRIVTMLREALGPWAVSGPALEAARRALRDRAWLAAAAEARARDARRIDALLRSVADGPATGTILYQFIRTERASELFTHLAQRGIWTRRFQHDPRALRFGLPGSEAAWARVEEAIGTFG